MRRLLILLICLWPAVSVRADGPLRIASPDGTVEFVLEPGDRGPTFEVTLDGQALFANSPLGLLPEEGEPWGPGMLVAGSRTSEHDETWRPVWGAASEVRDHYRQMDVDLRGPGGRALQLAVRAYDDGVAFRYRVPGAGERVALSEEQTAFRVTSDAKAFALPLRGFRTGYEASYRVCRVSELGETLIGLPLTLEFPGGEWAAITEAHLDDYAGLYLAADPQEKGLLRTRLSRRYQGAAVVREAPFETPWRAIPLGRSAGDLIESQTVLNLNPPCAIEDTSWIKPGKVAWDWWSKQMVTGVDFEGGMNTDTMKHYAEFAGEAGFEYLLIDEGWSWWENLPDDAGKLRRVTDITRTVPAIDLPEILDFCHRRGVRVWLWLTWGHCAAQMAEAFPLYERWGIAGVKVDFMNSDDQRMVNWYHQVAELAAKHHLMVDMHGAYKPTGIRRTWPNMMTREGVKGLEHAKWSSEVTPEHNVTLPFTRMLAGPMDYTPGGFNVTTPERFKPRDSAPFVMGTRCHQLAQYVVYESPIQMCVDYPGAYRGQAGFEFLCWVPTTWDESIVIEGYPGRSIAMARRHGNEWYVGGMTNGDARTIRIPLGFLGEGRWRLDAFADGRRAEEVPEQVRHLVRTVGPDDTLEVAMAPGGGYAARLAPDADGAGPGPAIRHLAGFRFKPEVTEAQKREVLEACDRLPQRIPQIVAYQRQPNVASSAYRHACEHALLFTFRSPGELDAYLAHPAHRELLEEYAPLLEDIVAIDWPGLGE